MYNISLSIGIDNKGYNNDNMINAIRRTLS